MAAVRLALGSSYARAVDLSLTDLPVIVPPVVGLGLRAGVIISGFTFLWLGVYYQGMITGGIVVVAAAADVGHRKKGKRSKQVPVRQDTPMSGRHLATAMGLVVAAFVAARSAETGR